MSSAANYATIITENNSSNIRVLANNISFQNWGGKSIAAGVGLATNLAAASNVTVMTITGCNVDVTGNINVSGNFTRNGVPLATTNWQQSNTTTFLSAGNKLGIGTTNTQGYDIYTAGEISASNIYARNAFFIGTDNQAVRNALQLSPLRSNFTVSLSNQSVFTFLQTGVYTGTAGNTDVYLNGVKLVYRDANTKDYDLSYGWTNSSNTQYTITLTQPATFGDIMDVAIWPSFYNTTSCNLPGYVYQTFGSYQWQNQGASNTYANGWVGIGTTVPTQLLDVRGNIRLGAASSYSNYVQSGSNVLLPVGNGLVNGINIGALNERTRPSYAVALSTVSSWTIRTSANELASWVCVCWSPKLKMFVAVAYTSTAGSRVMYSYDGMSWTIVNTGTLDSTGWNAVCWSQELGMFVAAGSANTMMYSYDGINWSSTTVGSNGAGWYWVCWAPEIGRFVAVMQGGTSSKKIAYSSNGTSWVFPSSLAADTTIWTSVCWSSELGIFVAISINATNRIMTSPDGENWTTRPSAVADAQGCFSICWSPELGLFVIVSGNSGVVLISSDGVNWASKSVPSGNWLCVCWSPELSIFVAVSNGNTNYMMTSPDGINWTVQKTASNNTVLCRGICWSPELSIFVTVSGDAVSGKQILTSAPGIPSSLNTILSPSTVYQSGYDVLDPLNLVNNSTLPPLPGIVGWYTGDSWTGTQWSDVSGANNHVTTVGGTISVGTIPNTNIKYLYGFASNTASLQWPAAILPSTYTFFHVTKYNGNLRKRIFTSSINWLSGHWSGSAGVAYHTNNTGWLTPSGTDIHGNNWVISTDQNTKYRSQGIDRTTVTGPNASAQLFINAGYGLGEGSDWACAEVIVYNRTLSAAEITNVESYLFNKYGNATTGFSTNYSFPSLMNTNIYGNNLLTVNTVGVGIGSTLPQYKLDVNGSIGVSGTANLINNASLPFLNGLVGWYTGDSWTGSQLSDLSGTGNHATISTGTITKATIPNTNIPYIYGGTSAAIVFPSSLLSTTYTIFHVIKYNGANRQRILTGANITINSTTYIGTNWWSGHKDISTNNPVAGNTCYHAAGFVTNEVSIGLNDNWIISTDQNNSYRSQGIDRTKTPTPTGGTNTSWLSINGYAIGEQSDWAVAEIIIYNRTLGLIEIQSIESYLINKYASVTTGFPSNYIYSPLLTTNVYGNRLLTVNPTGVGMGTTTPLNTLDVLGSCAIGTYAGTNAAGSNNLLVSGNVGIGSALPFAKLDVNGTLQTTGNVTIKSANLTVIQGNYNTDMITGYDTGSTQLFSIDRKNYAGKNFNIGFDIKSSGNLLLQPGAAGNVGIGMTTNPANALDVNGGVAIGTYAGTNFAGTNSLIVSGNVGIGTLSSPVKLRLYGSDGVYNNSATIEAFTTVDNYQVMQITPFQHDNQGISFDNFYDGSAWKSSHTSTPYRIAKSGGKFQILSGATSTANSTISWNGNYGITMDSTGNLGIGQVSPIAKLDIGGSSPNIYIRGNFAQNMFYHSKIQMNDQNFGIGCGKMNSYTSDNLYLYAYDGIGRDIVFCHTLNGIVDTSNMSNWKYDMIIKGNGTVGQTGNVGIGTTNPQAKLDVYGNARIGTAFSYSTYAQSGSNLLMPVSNGLINGVNIGALNGRTRASYAASSAAVRTWYARASANDAMNWMQVAWSPGLGMFVAVAFAGTGNRIMYSYDGIKWTATASTSDTTEWNSVCWSPDLNMFVIGGLNAIMYSYNGINWSSTSVGGNGGKWYGICWSSELGRFVALNVGGTQINRVAVSTNGTSWSLKATPSDSSTWVSVCWSPELGMFVAVSNDAPTRIMYSYDGNTWAYATTVPTGSWFSVCWSSELGIFVAVQGATTVITSSDGLIWTSRSNVPSGSWCSVCWAAEIGMFVAVANGTNYIMSSPDGINWTAQRSASSNTLVGRGICWSPELSIFVIVTAAGTGNAVQTSAPAIPAPKNTILAPSTQITVLPTTGSVGIGTTNPQYPLDVSGVARFQTYAFAFYLTPNTALTNGNPIPFNNANTNYPYTTITNNGFRAPVKGIYMITACLNLAASTNTYFRCGIHVDSTLNDTNFTTTTIVGSNKFIAFINNESTQTISALFNGNGSAIVSLNKDDYVRVFATWGSGTASTYQWGTNTYVCSMTGSLISAA